MSKRRTCSSAFKARVVLQLLGGTSQAEKCRQHHLKPEVIARWKVTAVKHLHRLFGADLTDPAEAGRVAELEQLVGRLTLQLEAAKKFSALLA